jgi:hypothetical protein
MGIPIHLLVISALLILVRSEEPAYKKVVHNTDPEARCIDGSSPAIYLHEGDPKNILFFFQGGADCAGKDLGDTL